MTIAVPVASNPDGFASPGRRATTLPRRRQERTLFADVSGGDTRQVESDADVRARLEDEPTTVPASGWEYADERTIRSAAGGYALQTEPCLRVSLYGGFMRSWLLWGSRRRAISSRSCGTPPQTVPALPIPLRETCDTSTRSHSQPTRALNDFVALGFNEGDEGTRHRRHAQVDRRRQRQSDQLSVRADRQNRAQSPEFSTLKACFPSPIRSSPII